MAKFLEEKDNQKEIYEVMPCRIRRHCPGRYFSQLQQLVPEIGYCEYNCTLCGNVCPTGAIPRLSLEHKKRVRLGLAEIDRSICIAWAEDKECIVCEEHCPVADKAIKLIAPQSASGTVFRPAVDPKLCVGCGICQNKCPTRPVRAIKVFPRYADRS